MFQLQHYRAFIQELQTTATKTTNREQHISKKIGSTMNIAARFANESALSAQTRKS